MGNIRLSESQLRANEGQQKVHSQLKKKGSLGSGIFTFGIGRKKGREAKPEKVIQPTASMPTPQRMARDQWDTQEHPGGQVSYRARSAVDTYKEHLTEDLVGAAGELIKDAELCTRANIICSRTYTGMPFPTSVSVRGLTSDQVDAQARFKWIMTGMDERFRAALSFLVMGVRSERMGAPRDFAFTASRYRDPTTKNAFTAGFLKAALIRLKEAQLAYGAKLGGEKRHAVSNQQAFDLGRNAERHAIGLQPLRPDELKKRRDVK